jgi:SH3 domain protein
MNMKFPFSITHSIANRTVVLVFVLFGFLPVNLLAETVYITDSLFIGLHKERSIDSEILKVLPTGSALEVISRDNDFVNVRDAEGVTGWISGNYLISNNPDINAGSDAGAGQAKRVRELEAELHNIRMQLTQPDKWHVIDPEETAKLKKNNRKLNQQINTEKLKSGELQANLAELRNQISQMGDSKKYSKEIQTLAATNAQLEEKIRQLSTSSKTEMSIPDNLNISYALKVAVIATFIGLLLGIIFMNWREKRRYGGLKL